jgi:Amylo-alpha-1,6-glucosidase
LDLIEAVGHRAVESLRRCCTPLGLQASGRDVGHHQVWTRDSMIASLGARLVPDDRIQQALRDSIAVLRKHRGASGAIPNNVDSRTERPNFRAYADSGLWWIVGSVGIAPDAETIRAILRWYECQDVDQSGLLSMQESSDWQDLFCTRGKGLYVNCLYILALRAAAEVFAPTDVEESKRCLDRARRVTELVNTWFWYRGDGEMLPHVSHTFSTENRSRRDSLGRPRWIPEKRRLIDEQYYLP